MPHSRSTQFRAQKVYNVTPGNEKVFIRDEIDWDDDITVRASIIIADPNVCCILSLIIMKTMQRN